MSYPLPPKPLEGPVDSFLLIGQSNMAGRGDFGEVPEIENPLCWMLRNGRWQEMREPICTDRMILQGYYGEYNLHSGVGLSASFADCYARKFHRNTGLIGCADGGTTMSDWMPGGVLYDNAVFQAKLAMRSSVLKGILWHQGEYDSGSMDNVNAYHDKFVKMISQLRNDLGVGDEVPVILGEIGEFIQYFEDGRFRYSENLNEVLRSLATEVPNAAIVSAKGLSHRNHDGQHFSSASYREFGRRYFEQYLSALEK